VQPGEYASRAQVQEYMEDYADAYSLKDHIRFNTEVTTVSQAEDRKNWKVQSRSTNDGDSSSTTTEEFDYLVVSTGLYSNRNRFIPNIPGQESFPGDIVHSCDFTKAAIAKDQRVVVLGGGKSAVDCAVTAARAGASSVTLLQRTPHWPTPRKIAGIIPFQYIFLSRLGTALVSLHRGTYPGSGKVVNMFRNSIIAPLLMKPVFGLVEELFAFQFGFRGELRPKEDVVTDFYNVALVLNSDLKDLRKQGKVDVKVGEIKSIDGSSLSLKDGQQLSADLIVSATGFSQDYSLFSDPAKTLDLQKDGMYLYRGILSDKTPNLAFIGHMAAISNISSYGLQAEWLARYLAGDLVDAPNAETMRQEIEARKAWARSWIPENSMRGMTVLLHQTHYHDQLLRDMGLNPHRKSNPLAEYLMPYEPADYNGIMGGAS
jgi:dimethylaniline monooxygenase (N-oxide forming)